MKGSVLKGNVFNEEMMVPSSVWIVAFLCSKPPSTAPGKDLAYQGGTDVCRMVGNGAPQPLLDTAVPFNGLLTNQR